MAMTDEELRKLSAETLLDLIIEEASEVIKSACKAKRFGNFQSYPPANEGRSNGDAVIRETVQVSQTVRIYCGKVGAHYGSALEGSEDELLPEELVFTVGRRR